MKFKLFTQNIQITKARNFEKMAGDETFPVTSVVLISAIFFRRRRCFFQRMLWIVEHFCSKAGIVGSACSHREISKVLAEELRDLMRPE